MTNEELLALPESKTIEFKRNLSSLDPILKTIIAFANTAGGTLIIGKNSDGAIVGIEDIFSAEERLANAIAENITPAILPEIEFITAQGHSLIVIKVPHLKGPIYFKRLGSERGTYIRLGSTSRPAPAELIEEMRRSWHRQSYDQYPLSHLASESLDLAYAYKMLNTTDYKRLEALDLLVSPMPDGDLQTMFPTLGGLILFGHPKERMQWIPQAIIRCALFQDTTKAHLIDQLDCPGPLTQAIEEIERFIQRNTRLTAEIKTMVRKDIPSYPPAAIREACVNALAHSDYSMHGSSIHIAIYSDRLEIDNPGMLPFGFTLEDFKSGASRIRNRVIARVFHQLGLMEEWGSGYSRIIEACRSGGYPYPRWEELTSSIRVTFYPHPKTQADQPGPRYIPQRRQAILDLFINHEAMAFQEIASQLPPLVSDRTLRYDLSALKKQGWLTSEGKGRGTRWRRLPPQ